MQVRIAVLLGASLLNILTVVAAEPAQKSASPDGKNFVEWRCKDLGEKNCDIRAIADKQQSKSVWKEVPAPTVTWYGNHLVEIRVGCGAPCFYSKFYSSRAGVSEPIEFVMAALASKEIAVRAGDGVLEVVRIFEKNKKPISVVKLDFAPAATIVNVLHEVKFVGENQLFVRYLAGKKFVEKSKTVALNAN